jgi:WD40 repeat protein
VTDVFISYSRRDAEFVRRLVDALAADGRDVWVDWEDIPPTADWLDRIDDGIDSTNAFVFVLSPDSAASEVCGQELAAAATDGKRIIPVLWRRIPDSDIPATLAPLNWIDLSDEARFDTQFPLLLQAMDTDLAWVEEHTRRMVQASEWEARGRDRSLLLRGGELDGAESWLQSGAGKEPAATPLQIEYLQASRKAAGRRQRSLLAGVSAALVLALVLAGLALISRNDARHQRNEALQQTQLATSRELSASAALVNNQDPELSLMLAARAVRIRPTDQAVGAVRRALLSSQVRATIPSGNTLRAELSADHRWVLTVSASGAKARTWHASDGSPAATLGELAVTDDGGMGNTVRTQAAFAPEGDGILAVTTDDRAAIFDPATGRATRTFRTTAPARDVVWSEGGRQVVVGDADGRITTFDADSGRELEHVDTGSAPVFSMAASDDGRTVVASTLDTAKGTTSAAVWDFPAATMRSRLQTEPSAFGFDVYLADDGARAITTSRGTDTQLWDSANGQAIKTITTSSTATAVSPDGSLVVVGGITDPIRVIQATTGEELRTYSGHASTTIISGLAFLPNGLVVSSAVDRSVLVWDPGNGQTQGSLRGLATPAVSVGASGDGVRVVTASSEGARVWNPGYILADRDVAADGGVLASDGRTLIISDGRNLDVVDAATGARRRRLARASSALPTVGISRDGSTAWWFADDAVDSYEIATGRQVGHLALQRRSASGAVAGSDGRTIAAGFYPHGGETDRVLVRRPGAKPTTIRAKGFLSLAMSPDGGTLAIGHGGVAHLYDTSTGHDVRTLVTGRKKYGSTTVAFSRDGTKVAVSSDDHIKVFRTRTGSQVGPPRVAPDQVVQALAFDPSGRRLAAAAFSGTDVWDLATARPILTLTSADRVERVSWSADGEFVITDDGVATEVYLASGEKTEDPFVHYPGHDATMSADGRHLVTENDVGAGATARVWPCDVCQGPKGLLALAARRVTRPFTTSERRRYLHGS